MVNILLYKSDDDLNIYSSSSEKPIQVKWMLAIVMASEMDDRGWCERTIYVTFEMKWNGISFFWTFDWRFIYGSIELNNWHRAERYIATDTEGANREECLAKQNEYPFQ